MYVGAGAGRPRGDCCTAVVLMASLCALLFSGAAQSARGERALGTGAKGA